MGVSDQQSSSQLKKFMSADMVFVISKLISAEEVHVSQKSVNQLKKFMSVVIYVRNL